MAHRIVFAVLLIASAAQAASGPQVVGRWDFNQPGNLEGWSAGPNVSDLTVADGRLRFKTRTNDPFIYAPPTQAPLDGCVVRVALRCRMATDTQVYWTTPEYPAFGEQQCMNRYAPGQTEGFTVLEFPIGKPSDAGRKLTSFRVDPCGGPVGETGEIDWVEMVRMPPLLEVRLAFDSHQVARGEPTRLGLSMRQIAGWKDQVARTARIGNAAAKPCSSATGSLPASEDTGGQAASGTKREGTGGQAASGTKREDTGGQAASGTIRFDTPGVQRERAVVSDAANGSGYDLQSSIIVGRGGDVPLVSGLSTRQLRLDLVRAAQGDHVGAARFTINAGADQWKLAGWLLPLARITVQTDDGGILQREPLLSVHATSEKWARLEGTVDDLPGWRVQVDFEVSTVQGRDVVTVTATLAGPQGGKLLEFAGPTLKVDREPSVEPIDRFAVFGGLEMLEPGWRSSSERAVGEKFAERHTPHPYKITVPMMAVEAGGLTTAMMWQPLDKWDGQHALPAATFASPDFLDGQATHLMRQWVPSVPDWVAENQTYARRPYVMSDSQPLTVRYVMLAEQGLPAMVASRRWFEIFGTPPPPPEVHGDSELYDLIARSYGQTMYWPAKGGWTQHWFMNQAPGYQPEMAAFLIGHAAQTHRHEWVQTTKLSDKSLIDAAVPLATRLAQGDQFAREMASSMRPDRTWPFQNTDQIRKTARQITDGKYDNLGEDGATELGVCAGAALGILRQAQLGGDPKLIEAGLGALQGMRRFRVPRGAQVWEVHLEIPDIRAAALAVEAFQIGYRLTGDKQYLDDASYWAWTGVPFVYSWRVPSDQAAGTFIGSRDRNATARESMPLADAYQTGHPQVTPYGTLPVLGPTYYVINWFGVLVQWCGLEWAEKVIALDADRPDPLLRAIAEGVVASGLQQMMDKEPWTGLYPDSWLLEQNIAQPAMIYPGLILACRQVQGRLPAWSKPWTRVLRSSSGQLWHASGWGKPLELAAPGGKTWSVSVEFLPGQPNELILARVDEPSKVMVGDTSLDRRPAPDQPGWTYDADRKTVLVRFVQSAKTARIDVGW